MGSTRQEQEKRAKLSFYNYTFTRGINFLQQVFRERVVSLQPERDHSQMPLGDHLEAVVVLHKVLERRRKFHALGN